MMKIKYKITVKTARPSEDSYDLCHDVTGSGSTRVLTFCDAVEQIAESFPQSKGHSITGVSSELGFPIKIR